MDHWLQMGYSKQLIKTEHLRMTAFKFICEFWEVFQNNSFIEHLWETAYLM